MHPTTARTARILLLIATFVALLAPPAAAGTKGKLQRALRKIYGVPVLAMEKVSSMQFEDEFDTEPLMAMPAVTLQQVVCNLVGFQSQCYLAELEVCPTSIVVQQGASTSRCDVDCHGNTPQGGSCECDIKLDTCEPT